MSWLMPAEWHPHECTWMAWPSAGYTLGDTVEKADQARQTWANVANAIVEFEPVKMIVSPGDEELASSYLDSKVQVFTAPLNDAWMRDIGPTFVLSENLEVAAVDWVFNGWGQQSWASWNHDSQIAKVIGGLENKPVLESSLVNEGGGIHVNGAGTILLTETVQLGEGRNSHLAKSEVESELAAKLGVSKFVWLKRGLTRDYDEFGTRGHVDIVACFASENTILMHDQLDPRHPDFEVSQEVKQTLEASGDFEIISIPAPKTLTDQDGPVDFSYINHYVCNGAVILCSFDDPNDSVAKAIIEKAYPGRKVVQVDARALFERGGGIHCITQQQPKGR